MGERARLWRCPMPMQLKIVSMLKSGEIGEVRARLADPRETYRSIAKWMRTRGWKVGPEHVRRYAVANGLRESRPNLDLKVDKLLSPEHRKEYEVLLKDQRTTLKAAAEWLKTRGYNV